MKKQTIFYIVGAIVLIGIIGYLMGWFDKKGTTSFGWGGRTKKTKGPLNAPPPCVCEPGCTNTQVCTCSGLTSTVGTCGEQLRPQF